MASAGKRAGARRGARPPRRLNPAVLGLCAGITLCVVAWGYLVYMAIDFGTAARSGDGTPAWALLALASLGAVACLFCGLMLVARLLRALGITGSDSSSGTDTRASSPAAPAPGSSASPGGSREVSAPGHSTAAPGALPSAHSAPHGGRPAGPRPRGGKRAAR